MDTERVNRLLTLGANVGVLIGLLLLVAEIRQTNAIAKAEAINALTQSTYLLMQINREPRQMAAMTRAKEVGWDELSADEQTLLGSLGAMALRHAENAYYQHKLGVYDSQQFEAVLWNLDQFLRVPWLQKHWELTKASHTNEFRTFVEARREQAAKQQSDEKNRVVAWDVRFGSLAAYC